MPLNRCGTALVQRPWLWDDNGKMPPKAIVRGTENWLAINLVAMIRICCGLVLSQHETFDGVASHPVAEPDAVVEAKGLLDQARPLLFEGGVPGGTHAAIFKCGHYRIDPVEGHSLPPQFQIQGVVRQHGESGVVGFAAQDLAGVKNGLVANIVQAQLALGEGSEVPLAGAGDDGVAVIHQLWGL